MFGTMNRKIFIRVVAYLFVLTLIVDCVTSAPEYQYKRYQYRKKSKNEKKIKSLKQQCESSSECQGLVGMELLGCARHCISPTCYDELYAHDPMEEGEIDVRFNSFKGCVIEQLPRF